MCVCVCVCVCKIDEAVWLILRTLMKWNGGQLQFATRAALRYSVHVCVSCVCQTLRVCVFVCVRVCSLTP